MSIKSKVLSAAAALTLLGGVGTASVLTAGPAHAATAPCGINCFNVFSNQFEPAEFLMDVWRQGANVGQPIILFRGSNIDKAEDFTVDIQAPVAVLAGFGLVSPLVALHYASEVGLEFEYTPNGTPTDLCVGVPTKAAFNGEGVSLQPCGVSGQTIWINDCVDVGAAPGCLILSGRTLPLISGATTTFTHPQVLTYPANSFPTDNPRPQLNTHSLQRFSNGHIFENQLWSGFFGEF